MTLTLSPPRGASAEPPPAVARGQRRRPRAAVKVFHELASGYQRLRPPAAVVLPPLGAVLILLSYHHAAELSQADQAQFALFWAGFLGGMLPLVELACAARSDALTRACALAGIGLFGMVPFLLRKPWPLDYDEFAHLRQALETFLNGDVGHPSQLQPITEVFPGLHQAVHAFARLTGLPLWDTGTIVIALAHVLSVLAIYQLVQAVGVPARGAAAGAVVYTLNPCWVWFDTDVSYESLALPMALWCLAATVAASRAPGRPSLRFIAVTALCAAALPLIHHLTTIVLCLIVALLIVVGRIRQVRLAEATHADAPQENLWPLLVTASCLLVSMAFWWYGIYDWIIGYLSPSLTHGWAQLRDLLRGRTAAESSGERHPFGGADNPTYEIASGLLFPALVLVLFAPSLAILWHNRRRFGSAPWAFAVLGGMYFLYMPMVVTKGGAEGAHRSWAFSFIGIAVLCGLAWSFGPASGGRPGVRVGFVSVVLVVMTLGGAALGANVSSRFPGSAHVGDDMRSVSREGVAITAWIAAHAPVDTPVLADRYVSQQLGSKGRMASVQPSPTFPIWDLYMSRGPVGRDVVKQVLDAHIRYLVVDARMATTRPRMGFWFTGEEPGNDGAGLFPQVAIDRFNCLPWLRATYAAGPLTVYEVDADVLRRTMAGSCESRGG